MDGFIIGSVIMIAIPLAVWLYREVLNKKRGEAE
jgi:hypothetical protein